MNALLSAPSLPHVSHVVRMIILALPLLSLACINVALAQPTCSVNVTHPGDEAGQSTIRLQMPFLAGQTWTVGGANLGSFYGNYRHCNTYNDHYATDWNRVNGATNESTVVAVADGIVSVVVTRPCPTSGYGCYVQIDHASGYRTLYAHLSDVEPGIVPEVKVKAGTILGKVGGSGNVAPHLHLSFLYNNGGGTYTSYCEKNCDSLESPKSSQGHKPSPMMTDIGPVNLADGWSYTSVNGRIYLPNLRGSNNWHSTVQVKNMSTSSAVNFILYVRPASGQSPCASGYTVAAGQALDIPVSCWGAVDASGFIDADQEIAVNIVNAKTTPNVVKGAYPGVPATAIWGPHNIPLVAKRRWTASGWSDSDILIQNAMNTAVTVQVHLIQPGQSSIVKAFVIQAYDSLRYRLDIDATIPDGWIGSAVVRPLVSGSLAVSTDFFTGDRNTDFAFNSYPPENKTADAYIPLFMVRRTGATGVASTPLSVQNVSSVAFGVGELLLICTADAGSGLSNFTTYNTVSVNPNESYAFNPATDTASFPISEWQGFCRLILQNQANGPKQFVTMAQIRYPANYNASAYEALRADGINKQAYFPVIQKRLPDGSATAIVVQNLSSLTANTQFQYKASPSCPGFSDVIVTYPIPAGQSVTHNHRLVGLGGNPNTPGYHGLPDGWCGSLRVISDQPIDGFGQITNVFNTSGDWIMAYNAITHP